MLIDETEIMREALTVARENFGIDSFSRRDLMNAVEFKIRQLGYWEIADDELSQSVARKSLGVAKIDWAITACKKEGLLLNISRNL